MGLYFIFCVSLSALFLSVQQTTGTTESPTVASEAQRHTISTQLKYLFVSCCLLRSVAYLVNGETDEGNTIFSQLPYLFILCLVASATAAEESAENEDEEEEEEEAETNETTTIDDMLKIHELPSWLDYDDTMYNPRPGYEPYWPVGEWVYKETFTTLYTSTSTIPPLIMGRPCPKYYREINETCATRLSAYWKTKGCNSFDWCWGYIDHLWGYHTFPTFCGFLQSYHQYSAYHRVVFVHIGKCVREKPLYFPFNPMNLQEYVLERYDHWMAKLNHTFFNITTERDLTLGPPVVKYGDKK